jgi:uncharacterized protein (TIGR03067 family)
MAARFFFSSILTLCLATACQTEQAQMNDQHLIQGTWRLTAGERQGVPFSADVLRTVTITFDGETLTTKTGAGSNANRFALDPTQLPKCIDMEQQGVWGEGIYELDGDTLTILHNEVGTSRPKTFDPKQSPQSTLMILARTKA